MKTPQNKNENSIQRVSALDQEWYVQSVGGFSKFADYAAVQSKAKEIYRNGGVEPTALGATYAEAKVTSTTGRLYITLLSFPDGDSSKITDWACECPWSKWNYKRSPRYKHLEHRKCSHALAMYYYLLAFKYTVAPKK